MSQETWVAIVGSGGREDARLNKYLESPHVDGAYVVPGNDFMVRRGISYGKPVRPLPFSVKDAYPIVRACYEQDVSLIDVPQDDAIAAGVVDKARDLGIYAFGATSRAGLIESSKIYCRTLGERYWPDRQPEFYICNSIEEGLRVVDSLPEDEPYWVKVDGSAAGKGAIRGRNRQEHRENVHSTKNFGQACERFLIEKEIVGDNGKKGEEVSYYVIARGEEYITLRAAQDYKREGIGDTGENTGSMGSVSPTLAVTKEYDEDVQRNLVRPILKALANEGREYTGVLYVSTMKVDRGGKDVAMLVEVNARPGDCEDEVITPAIQADFFEVNMMIARGDILRDINLQMDDLTRVAVAVASKGYPRNYKDVVGKEVLGISELNGFPNVEVYGAGLKYDHGKYRVSGGRILYIVGAGPDIISARENAYAAVSRVSVEGNNHILRPDIGWRDMEKYRRGVR